MLKLHKKKKGYKEKTSKPAFKGPANPLWGKPAGHLAKREARGKDSRRTKRSPTKMKEERKGNNGQGQVMCCRALEAGSREVRNAQIKEEKKGERSKQGFRVIRDIETPGPGRNRILTKGG